MGFLKKLFGKKSSDDSSRNSNLSPEIQEIVDSSRKRLDELLSYEPFDPDKYLKEKELKIAANPLSKKYRSPTRETECTVADMSLFEFKAAIRTKSYVCLDFETTGLSYQNDAIVEIGAVKVDQGVIISEYHQYVNPGIHISAAATEVNHITDDMVASEPMIYEVLPDLLDFIGDSIVVCHNAGFDIRFLCHACLANQFVYPSVCFDSMLLKEVWPDIPSKKLSCFLDAAGIVNEDAHSAIGDAKALAQLVILSMQKDVRLVPPEDFNCGYSKSHFTGDVEKIDDSLNGLRFVITGEIPGTERSDFEKMIVSHGGKCTLKISPATDFLIVGLFTAFPDGYESAKVQYAHKVISEGGKLKIINYSEFYSMFNLSSPEV